MPKPVRVSYSAIRSFRKCEQDYKYGYVMGLRPKVRFAPMELGTVIHKYFERYYGTLAAAMPASKTRKRLTISEAVADTAHTKALSAVLKAARKECKQLAAIAKRAKADGEAIQKLLAIPDTVDALMAAYHRVHGAADAAAHRVVMVEEEFEARLGGGYRLRGVIDMVTEDERGYWLWEHKTTGNVPPIQARLRDLQVALYAPALRRLFDIEIAGIIWNNAHTAPPREPAILKSGKMSVDKRCVTTVELTEAAIRRATEVGDYDSFLASVRQRERGQMFPRYELPLSQDVEMLMGDALHTAKRIGRARERGKDWRAVRTIDAHCDWCSFRPLCQGVITGGDEDVIMRTDYTKEKRDGKRTSKRRTPRTKAAKAS